MLECAFRERRKKIKNAISNCPELAMLKIPKEFGERRAEELSPEEFVMLSNMISNSLNNK